MMVTCNTTVMTSRFYLRSSMASLCEHHRRYREVGNVTFGMNTATGHAIMFENIGPTADTPGSCADGP